MHYLPVLLMLLSSVFFYYTEACSCSHPIHPQEAFCESDFVILARIRKVYTKGPYTKIYRIKIRKEFKMNENARIALKNGKIFTAPDDAMCGVTLAKGKLYLLSGNTQRNSTQAHINTCNFNEPWEHITNRQKKGFRLLYSKGCTCKISYFTHRMKPNRGPLGEILDPNYCYADNFTCQSKYGICLRSPSKQCYWTTSLDLRKCLKPFKKFKPRNNTEITTNFINTNGNPNFKEKYVFND